MSSNPHSFSAEQVHFDERGLVPCVVQEWNSGEVLMLAYMNRESLEKTLQSGTTWFWSRSRKSLWNKGETSGHVQKVRQLRVDCDGDTVLALVEQVGPACHTGTATCFTGRTLDAPDSSVPDEALQGAQPLYGAEPSGRAQPPSAADAGSVNGGPAHPGRYAQNRRPGVATPPFVALSELYDTLLSRREAAPEGSYTARLLAGGPEAIGAKVTEEAGEVVEAAVSGDRDHTIYEAGDLLYHLLVLLVRLDIPLPEVWSELDRRKG